MEIIIRDYRQEDSAQVASVFRDASQVLRKSRGGSHPDKTIDEQLRGSDRDILVKFAGGTKLIVAEVKETGEIVGTGGISHGALERLTGSTYSTAHYVKSDFQRGKAGVPVGSMIRKEILARATALGCRKIYGFSTPEAVGFHKKHGAVFFPCHDRYEGNDMRLPYYEVELKPSMWNRLRIEPYVFKLNELLFSLFIMRIIIFGAPKEKKAPAKKAS
ncbi:MAG: GNAT family protein [Candidatus ainarchaeum sp.]|nr:GNAT family protein [Candidatus ainarchaeum sp.]